MATCSPQIAAGGLADLAYQEEVCLGDLPAVPNMQVFRRRSTTLTLTKDSYTSEELRSDRMVADARHGTRRASGDIVVELSPGSHQAGWEALLGGQWTTATAINLATVSVAVAAIANDPDRITLTRVAMWSGDGIKTGDTIVFTGANAALDGKPLTVVGTQSAGTVLVCLMPKGGIAGLPITPTAGTLGIKGARASMGNVKRSFLFERAFTDIGSFITYRGMIFNTAAVTLPPTGIATCTFGMMGQNADPITGASFDGSAAIVVTDADLGVLTFDAAAGTVTCATSDWATEGFAVGDKVIFEGAGFAAMTQNQNPRTILKIATTTITVAEAVQSGATTGAYTATRVGAPQYLAAPNEPVLVAVSGVLCIDGVPVGTVTAADFTLDNQFGGSEVVGANYIPAMLYGLQCLITGNLTVLFDRGGAGEKLYNAFDNETDMSLLLRLDSADGADFMSFYFQRIKINSGDLGDAVATGLPVTTTWTALKPDFATTGNGSQIVVQDSTVVGLIP